MTELADIVRMCQPHFHHFSRTVRKAFGAILACRTALLGGQRFACEDCDYVRYVYHSCRHRACPKCQTQARSQWVQNRKQELLAVPYFHLVFTLPHALNPLIGWNEKNQRRLLNLLFQAASQTLLEFGESRLRGTIGVTMVLHTWTQQLQPHYHVHCVVPAGALSFDKKRWNAAGRKFLFPVRALSQVFRGKYVAGLKSLINESLIDIPSQMTSELGSPGLVNRWVRSDLHKSSWVVYSQRPFGGPQHVLEYLSRYTHRTAIGNERILSLTNGKVRFSWRDRRHHDELRSSTLDAFEFLKRFAKHILPDRFMRIRHYGLLANRNKTTRLNHCRILLGESPQEKPAEQQTALQWLEAVCGLDTKTCPCCQGELHVTPLPRCPPHLVEIVIRLRSPEHPSIQDSS